MLVRRLMTAVVVCSLSLGVVSCAEEEPTPKFAEPTSSAPSPTEAESAPPEREGAEDFIRRWVAASDRMQVTGDVAEYSEMTPRCKPCQGFVDSVRAVYALGGSAEFGGTKIIRIGRSGNQPPTYDVRKRVPITVIRHGDTGETQEMPGGTTTVRVTLARHGDSWTVTHFGIL